MRDYSKISAQFWTGKTGRELRGNLEAQVLALYLVTNQHSNMEGVYYCPVMFMAHETGMTLEGASKTLRRLIEIGFCTYDAPSEVVFVHEMAAHQIGDALKPKDNMVKSVQLEFDRMPEGKIKHCFFEKYGAAYHLTFAGFDPEKQPEEASPFEAPSKHGDGDGDGDEDGNKKGASKKFDPLDLDLPDCVSASAWSEWIQYRRSRRLSCAEITMRKQLEFLAEVNGRGNSPNDLMNTAIRNGWQGLFEPKSPAKKNPELVSRQARQVYQ